MYFTLTCLDSTFCNFKRLQNLLTSSTVTSNVLIGEVNWKPEQLMKKVRDLYPDYDFRLELTVRSPVGNSRVRFEDWRVQSGIWRCT